MDTTSYTNRASSDFSSHHYPSAGDPFSERANSLNSRSFNSKLSLAKPHRQSSIGTTAPQQQQPFNPSRNSSQSRSSFVFPNGEKFTPRTHQYHHHHQKPHPALRVSAPANYIKNTNNHNENKNANLHATKNQKTATQLSSCLPETDIVSCSSNRTIKYTNTNNGPQLSNLTSPPIPLPTSNTNLIDQNQHIQQNQLQQEPKNNNGLILVDPKFDISELAQCQQQQQQQQQPESSSPAISNSSNSSTSAASDATAESGKTDTTNISSATDQSSLSDRKSNTKDFQGLNASVESDINVDTDDAKSSTGGGFELKQSVGLGLEEKTPTQKPNTNNLISEHNQRSDLQWNASSKTKSGDGKLPRVISFSDDRFGIGCFAIDKQDTRENLNSVESSLANKNGNYNIDNKNYYSDIRNNDDENDINNEKNSEFKKSDSGDHELTHSQQSFFKLFDSSNEFVKPFGIEQNGNQTFFHGGQPYPNRESSAHTSTQTAIPQAQLSSEVIPTKNTTNDTKQSRSKICLFETNPQPYLFSGTSSNNSSNSFPEESQNLKKISFNTGSKSKITTALFKFGKYYGNESINNKNKNSENSHDDDKKGSDTNTNNHTFDADKYEQTSSLCFLAAEEPNNNTIYAHTLKSSQNYHQYSNNDASVSNHSRFSIKPARFKLENAKWGAFSSTVDAAHDETVNNSNDNMVKNENYETRGILKRKEKAKKNEQKKKGHNKRSIKKYLLVKNPLIDNDHGGSDNDNCRFEKHLKPQSNKHVTNHYDNQDISHGNFAGHEISLYQEFFKGKYATTPAAASNISKCSNTINITKSGTKITTKALNKTKRNKKSQKELEEGTRGGVNASNFSVTAPAHNGNESWDPFKELDLELKHCQVEDGEYEGEPVDIDVASSLSSTLSAFFNDSNEKENFETCIAFENTNDEVNVDKSINRSENDYGNNYSDNRSINGINSDATDNSMLDENSNSDLDLDIGIDWIGAINFDSGFNTSLDISLLRVPLSSFSPSSQPVASSSLTEQKQVQDQLQNINNKNTSGGFFSLDSLTKDIDLRKETEKIRFSNHNAKCHIIKKNISCDRKDDQKNIDDAITIMDADFNLDFSLDLDFGEFDLDVSFDDVLHSIEEDKSSDNSLDEASNSSESIDRNYVLSSNRNGLASGDSLAIDAPAPAPAPLQQPPKLPEIPNNTHSQSFVPESAEMASHKGILKISSNNKNNKRSKKTQMTTKHTTITTEETRDKIQNNGNGTPQPCPPVATVSFSRKVQVSRTYSSQAYDRRADKCNTFCVLHPVLVEQIKREVNEFKRSMVVHRMSVQNTHYY